MEGRLEPTNEGYALGKLLALKLTEYLDRDPERHYKTLMPCNLYGPGEVIDERHSHLVMAILLKLARAKLKGVTSVDIWGDGEARREFLFAPDFAAWVVQSVIEPEELPSVLNVGYGSDLSVNEYYELCREVVDVDVKFEHDLSRPVGMKRKLLDSSRAEALGWSPATTFADGIRETFDYVDRHYQPNRA